MSVSNEPYLDAKDITFYRNNCLSIIMELSTDNVLEFISRLTEDARYGKDKNNNLDFTFNCDLKYTTIDRDGKKVVLDITDLINNWERKYGDGSKND